ncbi:hypothetical protein OIT44_04210 [Weissella ceti]|uniref:Uncharacterized protein n=1 Tax=Weissella ceti TaxID=759620 RepID=A0ABT3E4D2_9LACO|nr:hypothetical protein [Weissella ceti]MCW0953279.1 hypothetical protein [Weissella ceti]QVK11388.1 hypothetical protein KHQ31_03965 [Weissella ceti]
MIETINATLFGMMCGVAGAVASYVFYTASTSGWQAVGDKLDALADKVWHIENTFTEQ